MSEISDALRPFAHRWYLGGKCTTNWQLGWTRLGRVALVGETDRKTETPRRILLGHIQPTSARAIKSLFPAFVFLSSSPFRPQAAEPMWRNNYACWEAVEGSANRVQQFPSASSRSKAPLVEAELIFSCKIANSSLASSWNSGVDAWSWWNLKMGST